MKYIFILIAIIAINLGMYQSTFAAGYSGTTINGYLFSEACGTPCSTVWNDGTKPLAELFYDNTNGTNNPNGTYVKFNHENPALILKNGDTIPASVQNALAAKYWVANYATLTGNSPTTLKIIGGKEFDSINSWISAPWTLITNLLSQSTSLLILDTSLTSRDLITEVNTNSSSIPLYNIIWKGTALQISSLNAPYFTTNWKLQDWITYPKNFKGWSIPVKSVNVNPFYFFNSKVESTDYVYGWRLKNSFVNITGVNASNQLYDIDSSYVTVSWNTTIRFNNPVSNSVIDGGWAWVLEIKSWNVINSMITNFNTISITQGASIIKNNQFFNNGLIQLNWIISTTATGNTRYVYKNAFYNNTEIRFYSEQPVSQCNSTYQFSHQDWFFHNILFKNTSIRKQRDWRTTQNWGCAVYTPGNYALAYTNAWNVASYVTNLSWNDNSDNTYTPRFYMNVSKTTVPSGIGDISYCDTDSVIWVKSSTGGTLCSVSNYKPFNGFSWFSVTIPSNYYMDLKSY